jgi:hypothetical protein
MTPRTPMFLVGADHSLTPMRPSAPTTEDELQALIARHPELIGDTDGELLLVQREAGVPDTAESAGRWSLDHLFITRAAVPVLVEVKRAVDTRLRREVVGQMMDYAANAVVYWRAGELAQRFAEACAQREQDPGMVLGAFLKAETTPEQFWAQADANLAAGKVKLLFVADEIPPELARIVEFMNDQMTADVRAIEMAWYEADGGLKTLAPRVIGETERARAAKAAVTRPALEPVDIDTWLQRHMAPELLPIAKHVLNVFSSNEASVAVASTQGSIVSSVRTANGRQCYPLLLLKNGSVQVALGWVMAAPVLAPDAPRQAFYVRFTQAVGKLSTPRVDGFPSFPLRVLADPACMQAFEAVARDFYAACRAPAAAAP